MQIDLSTVVAFISLVGGIVAIIQTYNLKNSNFAKLELKVDTMWDFMMRRAKAEGVNSNFMTMNSPIAVKPDVLPYFKEMTEELKAFYKNKGVYLDELDAMLEIERLFGDRILKEICIPHKLSHGACLHAALEVAKTF